MQMILEKVPFHEIINQEVLVDANIFMVGADKSINNLIYSFESMKNVYLIPFMESMKKILIHEAVYEELDSERKAFIDLYEGKNVTIVKEDGLYDVDPQYVSIFNEIAEHELVRYSRKDKKNKGEVYSMAYAAYHGIDYISSRDAMVDIVVPEIEKLHSVNVITFDFVLFLALLYHQRHGERQYQKAIRSLYKEYCADVIKRHHLPFIFSEYVQKALEYMGMSTK